MRGASRVALWVPLALAAATACAEVLGMHAPVGLCDGPCDDDGGAPGDAGDAGDGPTPVPCPGTPGCQAPAICCIDPALRTAACTTTAACVSPSVDVTCGRDTDCPGEAERCCGVWGDASARFIGTQCVPRSVACPSPLCAGPDARCVIGTCTAVAEGGVFACAPP